MALEITANSYGSTDGVAALTPLFVDRDSLKFDGATRPAVQTVINWIDQVSEMCNAILAENGFSTPITDARVKLALDNFINQEVASMVEGVNGAGRFGPRSRQVKAQGRFSLLANEVRDFIEGNTIGFERMGATMSDRPTGGILFRDTNEAGDESFPIFQREGFGNKFDDWDQ